MNTRVMLLALTTTVFAAAWRSDQPRLYANSTATHPQSAVRLAAIMRSVTSPSASSVVSDVPDASSAAERVADLSVWLIDDVAIPLPPGLTAGQYCVVNSRGWMQSLTLTPHDLSSRGIVAVRRESHVYSVMHEGRRWHFIRIESPQTAAVGKAGSSRN